MTIPSLLPVLPTLMVEPLVRAALLEDLGRAGDLTTDAIVPAAARGEAALVARQAGIIAGLGLAFLPFRGLEPAIEIRGARSAGTSVSAGGLVATIPGPARGPRLAGRVAPHLLGHL